MQPIGIMQGRLSPPMDGRIQSFPVATWRDEFGRARDAGLACIEWIYETETDVENPLRTDEGLRAIERASAASGVQVRSICADYYMSRRLIGDDGAPDPEAAGHLAWLIGRAGALGVRYMVLPFVDSSSLRGPAALGGLRALLEQTLPIAERHRVELHLETDLEPTALADLLGQVGHSFLRANYDMGNSASLGHDPREELTVLKPWIGSVHVKDRVRGGGTVPLGTGSVDVATCFHLIEESGFAGPYILQVARGEAGDEAELAIRNRRFVEEHIRSAVGGSARV